MKFLRNSPFCCWAGHIFVCVFISSLFWVGLFILLVFEAALFIWDILEERETLSKRWKKWFHGRNDKESQS
jgi:hypothetical protein